MIGSPASINGGFFPVSGADLTGITFTNLAPANVDAAHLANFDTAVLNVVSPEMRGTVNTLTAASKQALDDFVGSGHKLIIRDSESSAQNYSWLPYSFQTNNPGQTGSFGSLVIAENNTLTNGINATAIGSQTDAAGDSNVMVTLDPHWAVDMTARNANGKTGPVQTYAEFSSVSGHAGLMIYDSMDVDYMPNYNPSGTTGADYLRKVWMLELRQPFDTSGLPFGVSVVGVTMSPSTGTDPVGATHTVTATLKDQLGNPQSNVHVTFSVIAGPNAGAAGTTSPSNGNTNSSGQVSFTYTGSGGPGTDQIVARFTNNSGQLITSQAVNETWFIPTPPNVTSFVVDDGTPQRSMVRSLHVTFNEAVTLDPGAFQIVTPAGVQPVTLSVNPSTNGAGATVANITFTGNGISAGSLEDGQYTLLVKASKVHDAFNQFPTNDIPETFFRLFGDYTGDGIDDNLDLAYYRLAIMGSAQYLQYFDYDGNSLLNTIDTTQVMSRRYKRVSVTDSTPPVVTYTAPTPGIATRTNPAVAGLVLDDLSGVASLQGQLDSGPTFPVTVDPAGHFNFATGLALDGTADGMHTIHLRATDVAGNVSVRFDDGFVLDTTAPAVVYTSPLPGTVSRTNPTVAGTVADVLSGVASLQAQVDGGSPFLLSFDAAGHFSFTTGLPLDGSADGLHTVHLVATDKVGNVSGSYDDTFVLDTTAPVITSTSPTAGSNTRTNPTVSGLVIDPAGVATLQGQVDAGSTFPVAFDGTGKFSFATGLPLNGSADGAHTVHLISTDLLGNVSGSYDITFGLDTTSPLVAYTFPLPGGVTDSAMVNGRVTDALSGVASLQGQVDGGPTFPVSFNLSGDFSFTTGLPLDGSADGLHTVHLVATDEVGNVSGSYDDTFVLDTSAVFTDPNLEAAARAALGLPAGHRVTRSDLFNLTTLTADSNLVTNLTGLQYAVNLQSFSLVPSDWSLPGHITDLSPLSGLTHLQSLALVDAGVTNGELTALGHLAELQTLDLRYDAVSDVSAVAELPSLSSLRLYADPVSNLAPLAGKLINIDLPPANPEGAKTVADLASALHDLPIAIFQYVVDNFAYQAYAGAKKGPQAALETKAGNDWDLDTLLAALLGQAGVATRYVSGTVEVPTQTVMAWLGMTDPSAAGSVLANAGLHPIQLLGPGGQSVSYRFDHTWVEAQVSVPGAGVQWIDLDPSWKFKDYQPGIANILSLVPFNESDYLSKTRPELTYEYYENQVASYLAAHLPSASLADVAYDGPVHPQVFTALPTGLPYTVVGATTTATLVPDVMMYRVGLTLRQGGTTLLSQVYELPQISLERVTIGYAPAPGGTLTPELLLDGNVVATGPAVANRSGVTLVLDHYDPGSTGVSQSFTYDRLAGQYLAVGLDAGQLSDAYLARQQSDINTAAIAARDNLPFSTEDQVGAFLALAIGTYFHNSDTANQVVDGLTHAVPVFNHVASGIATGETTITYHWDLQNPALPDGVNVDVANAFHQEFALDGRTANDAARNLILGDDGSAEEHAVWEQVANTTGISTIKSLQLANERGIPVFTITSGNAAVLVPQLTLNPSTISAIQSEILSGATVTVPRDPTPLNKWQGVGYISRHTFANGFSEAYIIAGGLASQSLQTIRGGSGTGDPNSPNSDPGNNPNDTYAGDPVNIANGDVTSDETDFRLPGIGLSLDFERRYDSQNTVDAGLGVGWVHSYSDHLDFPAGGAIVWTDNQGRRFTFTPNGSGGYTTPPAIYGTLSETAMGYEFRAKDGLVHAFDTLGRLTEIRDRNGNALEIAYDGSGHLVSVTEADSPTRQLLFTYTGSHITSLSDGTGRSWTYSYTGSELTEADAPSDAQTPQATVRYDYYTDAALGGLLKQVTEPNGGSSTFTYYGNRRSYQVTDPEGFTHTFSFNLDRNLTAFVDERGNVTSYGYDASGEQVSVQHPDRARETTTWANGLKQSETDAFGQTTSYQYDALGNLTQVTDRAGNITQTTYDPVFNQVTSVSRPGSQLTTYDYDANGNLVKITDPMSGVTSMTRSANGLMASVTKPRGNQTATPGDFTTTYTYNDAGQVLTITTDLPSLETLTYDSRGHLIAFTDANNHTTRYDYDLLDRVIRTTDPYTKTNVYVYDPMGDLLSTMDRLGRTTQYTYDLRQHPVKTTNADGTVVIGSFDGSGNQTARTDELGRTTTTVFDAQNRPIGTVYADGTLSRTVYDGGGRTTASVDPNGNATRYGYDTLGRLATVTDALGQAWTRSYDAAGNLTSVTDPLNRTTRYGYDLLNRTTSVTDALNKATITAYDADGNVISVTDPLNHTTSYSYDVRDRLTATTDALNQTTLRTYDAVGNVLTITDPAGNTTSNTYDDLNRKATETNALNNSRIYGYDAVGDLTSSIDRDGRTTRFTYDPRDRQVSEQWLDSSGQPVRTALYTYDAAGQMTSASDPDSAYTYTYDVRGRRTSEDNKGTPGAPDVLLTYAYDNAGNLKSVTDQINGTVYGTESYTYDADNRVTEITQTGNGVADKRVDLTYDASGELKTLNRYSDLAGAQSVASSVYTYDNDGRLTGLTDAHGTAVIDEYQWALDDAGRVTQETGPDGITPYGYDATNQLVSANNPSLPGESYSYDANGNRTNVGYQTGPDNQLLADGTYSYAYDGEGNLTRRTEIATRNVTEYTYDDRNRLTRVVSKDSAGGVTKEVDYTYDVFNRRIARSVDPDGAGPQSSAVTRFVYRGDNIALQFNGTGALTDRYLYGPAVDQILADDANEQVTWSLADRLGSVRNVLNGSGAVIDHIVYNSFGQITAETNPALRPTFTFTGRELDPDTGLQYNRARYYDPSTGRFISQDPIRFLSGDPNLYTYAQNEPTNGTDPTGRSFWDRYGTAITIGGIVLGSIGLAILTGGLSLGVEAELAIDVEALELTETVASNIATRPFINSPLLIQEIIEAVEPVADEFVETALRWDAPGSFNGSEGIYELVINLENNTIYHFLFTSL